MPGPSLIAPAPHGRRPPDHQHPLGPRRSPLSCTLKDPKNEVGKGFTHQNTARRGLRSVGLDESSPPTSILQYKDTAREALGQLPSPERKRVFSAPPLFPRGRERVKNLTVDWRWRALSPSGVVLLLLHILTAFALNHLRLPLAAVAVVVSSREGYSD